MDPTANPHLDPYVVSYFAAENVVILECKMCNKSWASLPDVAVSQIVGFTSEHSQEWHRDKEFVMPSIGIGIAHRA